MGLLGRGLVVCGVVGFTTGVVGVGVLVVGDIAGFITGGWDGLALGDEAGVLVDGGKVFGGSIGITGSGVTGEVSGFFGTTSSIAP